MSWKRLVQLIATVIVAVFLLTPAATSGADAECLKECREEFKECVDLCKKYVKNPAGLQKCIDEGCKKAQEDCFKDCN